MTDPNGKIPPGHGDTMPSVTLPGRAAADDKFAEKCMECGQDSRRSVVTPCMPLSEDTILATLMGARTRLSAAIWLVVRDANCAEDIFQNVAIKALTKDVQFPSESALMSWAMITARREGLNWVKRRRYESPGLSHELLSILEDEWLQEETDQENQRIDALRECLADLPENSRKLLEVRYFESQSCGRVAEQLGIGLDAVYKRLSRLHAALGKCIRARLESPPATRRPLKPREC